MKKPSVTELIALLDKPALLKWANQKGLEGIDISKERSKWLGAGLSIHSQIEGYVKSGTPFISKDDELRFCDFLKDKDIISYETDIETEWFVGRYDMKIKWKDKTYIIDFKNNAKRVYFEHKLQLVAYSMADPCDAYAIVSVPSFTVMNIKIENIEPYHEIMKSLSSIYTHKQTILSL